MSDQFENVAIVKKANVYFDGKATSRTVLFADGTRKTLGFIMPGETVKWTCSCRVNKTGRPSRLGNPLKLPPIHPLS
jgi:hypothetical protein